MRSGSSRCCSICSRTRSSTTGPAAALISRSRSLELRARAHRRSRTPASASRPEHMRHLFEPFERLGAEQSTVEGTGLGLALSKGLIETMGGTIDASSTPGVGSTFAIELDGIATTSDRARAKRQSTGQRAARRDPATLRILYIDDNVSNVRLVERMLDRHAESRADPRDARLNRARARTPTPSRLIILDLHLPDIQGEEVLNASRPTRYHGHPRHRAHRRREPGPGRTARPTRHVRPSPKALRRATLPPGNRRPYRRAVTRSASGSERDLTPARLMKHPVPTTAYRAGSDLVAVRKFARTYPLDHAPTRPSPTRFGGALPPIPDS